jgi:hypothetical protein
MTDLIASWNTLKMQGLEAEYASRLDDNLEFIVDEDYMNAVDKEAV